MMGGDLVAESVLGEGSTFTMSVLRDGSDLVLDNEHQSSEVDVSGDASVVLVIDDDANVRELLTRNFAASGLQTVQATNGEEGLQLAQQVAPDAITLDVMMPKTNGFEVCRRIREQSRLNNLKIVMLTAKGREAEVTKGLALGADSYIIKPFSTRELMSEVKKHLE